MKELAPEPCMTATPEQLLAYLERLGIKTHTTRYEAVFTVEESRTIQRELTGVHTKNLFLADKKDRLFLVSAEQDAEINLKQLHNRIGASGRLSFGKPASMRKTLGVDPGSVTPFGAINDRAGRVTVILDRALVERGTLNFHPLVNTGTTRIEAQDLLRFLRKTGHEPLVLDVSGTPAA
jgi:Ala-tRNA(Pro) deacylase